MNAPMNPFLILARAGATLGLAAALAACGEDHHDHDGHDHGGGHAHAAQFGGEVVELGDHFANLEVVHDGAAGTLAVYCMDGHNENTVRSSTAALKVTVEGADGATFELTLAPDVSELTGNKAGASSLFRVSDERLKGLDHLHGTVASVEVLGTTFEDVDLAAGHDHDEADDHHDDAHEGEDSDG